MARTETAGNLITRAKERSDMENSNFVSDAEWYRSLNRWSASLWNKLVKADPDRYTVIETLTAAGSTDFTVAANYYGTVKVEYVSNSTDGLYIPLPRLFGEEENLYLQAEEGRAAGYTFAYNAATPSTPILRVFPIPDADLRHHYIVAPPSYATDGTDSAELVIGVAGLEEYIVIGMAIDAKIKEGSSVVQLRESQQLMVAELEEAAENRSVDTAGHVHDSRKSFYFDPASQRWGTRYD